MICSVMEACKDGLVRQGLLSCEPLSIPDDGIKNKLHSSNIITQIMHGMRKSTLGTCAFSRYGTVTAADVQWYTYNNGYIILIRAFPCLWVRELRFPDRTP